MSSLREQMGTGDKRSAVIADACQVLDAEVADKGGLSGIAIKGAYKIVQGVRPGFIRDTVNNLLDDFLDAVDPVYQEAAAKKVPAGGYLQQNSGRVAQALLAVTDARAARIDHEDAASRCSGHCVMERGTVPGHGAGGERRTE